MKTYKQVPADHKGIPGTWNIQDAACGKYMEFYCHLCGLPKHEACLISSGFVLCKCGMSEIIKFEKVEKVND